MEACTSACVRDAGCWAAEWDGAECKRLAGKLGPWDLVPAAGTSTFYATKKGL